MGFHSGLLPYFPNVLIVPNSAKVTVVESFSGLSMECLKVQKKGEIRS